jgi:hypothetical protein
MNKAELTHMILMGQEVFTDGVYVGTEEQWLKKWRKHEGGLKRTDASIMGVVKANALDVIQLEVLEDE